MNKTNIKNIIDDRRRKIGKRIRDERQSRSWSQTDLGNRLADMREMADENGRTIGQGTISKWETGDQIPTFTDLICLSRLFNCDIGYLLCDYDAKTYGENEISSAIGLPPENVRLLKSWATWEISERLSVLSILIYDDRYNVTNSRSILDMINFFLSYHNDDTKKLIWSNGQVTDDPTTDGAIFTRALRLSDNTVENAVLIEIQEALRALKHSGHIAQKGANNG